MPTSDSVKNTCTRYQFGRKNMQKQVHTVWCDLETIKYATKRTYCPMKTLDFLCCWHFFTPNITEDLTDHVLLEECSSFTSHWFFYQTIQDIGNPSAVFYWKNSHIPLRSFLSSNSNFSGPVNFLVTLSHVQFKLLTTIMVLFLCTWTYLCK